MYWRSRATGIALAPREPCVPLGRGSLAREVQLPPHEIAPAELALVEQLAQAIRAGCWPVPWRQQGEIEPARHVEGVTKMNGQVRGRAARNIRDKVGSTGGRASTTSKSSVAASARGDSHPASDAASAEGASSERRRLSAILSRSSMGVPESAIRPASCQSPASSDGRCRNRHQHRDQPWPACGALNQPGGKPGQRQCRASDQPQIARQTRCDPNPAQPQSRRRANSDGALKCHAAVVDQVPAGGRGPRRVCRARPAPAVEPPSRPGRFPRLVFPATIP